MAQTAQQRRKAQREIARKLKTHQRILPEEFTRKAKAVAGEKKDLFNQIDAWKQQHYGTRPKWNEKTSKKTTRINGGTGKPWTTEELRKILAGIQGASQGQADAWDWEDAFEENEDYASALYYH